MKGNNIRFVNLIGAIAIVILQRFETCAELLPRNQEICDKPYKGLTAFL